MPRKSSGTNLNCKFGTNLTPVDPALQVQLVGQALHVELAEAPTAVEYVPAAQSVHVAFPVNVLYLPATHAMHVELAEDASAPDPAR